MAWELLFSSDIGLMSLVVIVGVLVIGAVMGKMYSNKMEEESRKPAAQRRPPEYGSAQDFPLLQAMPLLMARPTQTGKYCRGITGASVMMQISRPSANAATLSNPFP